MTVLNAFQTLRPRGVPRPDLPPVPEKGKLQPRVLAMMRAAGVPLTNREVAQMCDITAPNAWSVVRGLARQGAIRVHSYDKRGAAMYEVAP